MNLVKKRRAILFAPKTNSMASLTEFLEMKGFDVFVPDDLEAGLAEHGKESFQLAIIEEGYKSLSASLVVQELLKVSWATNSIIITDKNEDQLHEQTEGLGILGAMKDVDDFKRLEELLATLNNILGWENN